MNRCSSSSCLREVWRRLTLLVSESVWCHRRRWAAERCSARRQRTRQNSAAKSRSGAARATGQKGSSNPFEVVRQIKAVVWRTGSGVGWKSGRGWTLSGDHGGNTPSHACARQFSVCRPVGLVVASSAAASMGGAPRTAAALEQNRSEHSGGWTIHVHVNCRS